jgi:hypothetical protein
LCDDVATLAAFIEHRLDAANLSFDASQAALQISDDVVAELHEDLLGRRANDTPRGIRPGAPLDTPGGIC